MSHDFDLSRPNSSLQQLMGFVDVLQVSEAHQSGADRGYSGGHSISPRGFRRELTHRDLFSVNRLDMIPWLENVLKTGAPGYLENLDFITSSTRPKAHNHAEWCSLGNMSFQVEAYWRSEHSLLYVKQWCWRDLENNLKFLRKSRRGTK